MLDNHIKSQDFESSTTSGNVLSKQVSAEKAKSNCDEELRSLSESDDKINTPNQKQQNDAL